MNVGVLGAGSFGTSLAHLLATKGYEVVLWAREPAVADGITAQGRNPRYLTDIDLPDNLRATHELGQAVADKDLILCAVPAQAVREVLTQAHPLIQESTHVVSTSKGIEEGTLLRMSEVSKEVLGEGHWKHLAYLSGPSFAREVASKMTTAVTMAAEDVTVAKFVQETFSTPYFRTYYTTDVVGLELGGALKNVFAIGAGISDGLGLGNNARAALITRGLAEIARLGIKLGANPLTLAGLAGMGDLVLTCTGGLSRNRKVGLALGQGESIDDILGGMDEVAEGVKTAQCVVELAQREGVEMPLAEAVSRVLSGQTDARTALTQLMARELKAEQD